MTFSRNKRRRNGKTKPREGMNPYYGGFWAGMGARDER